MLIVYHEINPMHICMSYVLIDISFCKSRMVSFYVRIEVMVSISVFWKIEKINDSQSVNTVKNLKFEETILRGTSLEERLVHYKKFKNISYKQQ